MISVFRILVPQGKKKNNIRDENLNLSVILTTADRYEARKKNRWLIVAAE